MNNITTGQLFIIAADKLKLNHRRVPNSSMVEIYNKKKSIIIRGARTSLLSANGELNCSRKNVAKNLVKHAGLSTARWVEFYKGSTGADIDKYLKKVKFPVVIKPQTGTHGNDIFVGIETLSNAKKIVKKLQKNTEVVVVEEMFQGTEIRIVATPKKVLAAAVRRPASVLGDGNHTIKELINIKNKDSRRLPLGSCAPIQRLPIDNQTKLILSRQNIKLESIPKNGDRVYLRATSNLCQGGDSIDITDKIHSSVKKIAIRAVAALKEVPLSGVDFMTKNYTKKQTKNSYIIIEMNHDPMLTMHYRPYEGKSRNVAEDFLKTVFNI